MIELFDFGKDYGEFTAVQSLNLKIEAGEMFGFIGPNGAGKSTTIRYLATLLKPLGAMLSSTGIASTKIQWLSAAVLATCLMISASTTE